MSRKEATNTFSDGLVTDLNPINTPNSVLTDCVNGTILTYNGNELSLQNDMGNYMLKDCKLNENYIPVGLKEYGDILYIVSYNPLDKHVEIGSYPSPLQVEDENSPGLQPKEINTVCDAVDGDTDYNEFVKSFQKLQIFYGENPEISKINPGDQYRINNPNVGDYAKLKFFILDENRNLYDITDNINNDKADSDFKYVSWKVPGWLAVQPKFIEFDEFKVNVTKNISFKYLDPLELQNSFNFQWISSDDLLDENSSISNFGIKMDVEVDNNIIIQDFDIPFDNLYVMGNGNKVLYTDWNETIQDLDENSIVKYTFTPFVTVCGSKIKFEPKEIVFNMGLRANPEDIKIGTNLWKYTTTKEKLFLRFDTTGLDSTAILTEDIKLYYSIRRLGDDSNPKEITDYQDLEIDSWNIDGETNIIWNLEPFDENTLRDGKFCSEDIYIITFKVRSSKDDENLDIIEYSKLIVATELMNGFEDLLYDEITFDRWISRYPESIKNNKFEFTDIEIKSRTPNSIPVNGDSNYLLWSTDSVFRPYSRFINYKDADNLTSGFDLYLYNTYEVDFNISSDFEVLHGPLWIATLENAKLTLDNDKDFYMNIYTGKISGFNDKKTSNCLFTKTLHYDLTPIYPENRWIYYYDEKQGLKLKNVGITCRATHTDEDSFGKNGNIITITTEKNVDSYDAFEVSENNQFEYRTGKEILLELLNNYDVLRVTFTIEDDADMLSSGAKKWAWAAIAKQRKSDGMDEWKENGTASTDEIYKKTGEKTQDGKVVPFLVFKLDGDLYYICDERMWSDEKAYSKFLDNWLDNTVRIDTDSNNRVFGNFYTCKLNGAEEKNNINIVVNNKYNGNSFKYDAYNLLLTNDRLLLTNYLSDELSTVTKNFILNINLGEPFDIKFEEINQNLYYLDKSKFDEDIEELKSQVIGSIDLFNQEVSDQYNKMETDQIYNNGVDVKTKYYYSETMNNTDKNELLLNLLNKTISVEIMDFCKLIFDVGMASSGNQFYKSVILGKTNYEESFKKQ